jgi:hypothetical protein
LINNKYNNFTITEFRDELVKCSDVFNDKNLARKFIYRQVYRLLHKGLLVKIVNSGNKQARYIKPELFQITSFINKNKKLNSTRNVTRATEEQTSPPSFATLEKEKMQLEEKLAITISEVSVYSELLIRLPAQATHLRRFQFEAKSTSIYLTGRINALEKILNVL